MTTMTETRALTTQVYRVFIKATPGGDLGRDHRPRSGTSGTATACASSTSCARAAPTARSPARRCARRAAADVAVDGEVVEVDPPRRLVQTWRSLWDPEIAAEAATRSTGRSRPATQAHAADRDPRVEGRPVAATSPGEVPEAGGGWSWILSDLKTLLETGRRSPG